MTATIIILADVRARRRRAKDRAVYDAMFEAAAFSAVAWCAYWLWAFRGFGSLKPE